MIICPIGSYCTGGSQNACTAGFYGSSVGLSVATCDGLCSGGYYCPSGSNSSTSIACPSGYFCPNGSASATVCPLGYFNFYHFVKPQ